MFTAQMQFYCKLSDPILGGTYLYGWLAPLEHARLTGYGCRTLLNTLSNLGAIWPSTMALKASCPTIHPHDLSNHAACSLSHGLKRVKKALMVKHASNPAMGMGM
jgi:hypothetical protein